MPPKLEFSAQIHFRSFRKVLAFGADSKNSVCLLANNTILLSSSHGSLLEPDSVSAFEKAIKSFIRKAKPEYAAVDLHPDYYSSVYGERTANSIGIPVFRIQHHHAHAAACMAEHGLGESLALVLDGTGYGADGSIWGAELLHVHRGGFTRMATFEAAHLPGGDISVRHPARQLIGRFSNSIIGGKTRLEDVCSRYDIDPAAVAIWIEQVKKNINCPKSHSAGRLFDSVSALLGFAPARAATEAEAAIHLQQAAESCSEKPDSSLMPFEAHERDGMLFIDWSPVFNDTVVNYPKSNLLALSFHHSIADAALKMVEFGSAKFATRNIVLSGGVFMNKLLLGLMEARLGKLKLKVFSHCKVPANDCGIAVGQAAIASGINKAT